MSQFDGSMPHKYLSQIVDRSVDEGISTYGGSRPAIWQKAVQHQSSDRMFL